MTDSNGKLPVGIVTTVIDKISEFTKEIEILRAQLPNKETTDMKIEALDTKLDKVLIVIKTVFVLSMLVVGLSFLGAKFINTYSASDHIVDQKVLKEFKTDIQTEMQHKLDELCEKRDQDRNKDMKIILEKLEELKIHGNKKEDDGIID